MIPFVSILVPCYNEERFIGTLLENLVQQDYPGDHLEILIIDGGSADSTREIISGYAARDPKFRLLDNPAQYVPFALNAGIRLAHGEVIVRMDAHAEYPTNYVSLLVQSLFELKADNVGGTWVTMPGGPGLKSLAVARVLSSPFGIGNAEYRLNVKKIRRVDTVPFGCYLKSVFDKIGFFDEELLRNQDIEFNGRLLKNGGTIYLVPEVRIIYYARDSVKKLLNMFFQYSMFRPLVNKKLGMAIQPRQFVPPVWVIFLLVMLIGSFFSRGCGGVLLGGLGLYFICDLIFSIRSAVNANKWGLMLYLPWIFFVLHITYGIGYIRGLINFTLLNRKPQSVSSTR
ncbi:MAG: glycosyltransferase family 2 protein [Bacteroidetes bacterium]|nr:glycosyltransferase family 2 protein [Bacteroidota bacterium]